MGHANGRLPGSALAAITKAANGEQARLGKPAAAAFMAMNAESEQRFGVTLRVGTARVAYRTYEEQVYFWERYQAGTGDLAARPGTSNHGLGLAIDLATVQMRQIVDEIGERYGFAKRWSDAPGEWWHIKWRPGDYVAVERHFGRWRGYTDAEKRWIEEYDRLKRAGQDLDRRKVLRRVMKVQRKKIWKAAKATGWDKHNRRARYRSLLARTSDE